MNSEGSFCTFFRGASSSLTLSLTHASPRDVWDILGEKAKDAVRKVNASEVLNAVDANQLLQAHAVSPVPFLTIESASRCRAIISSTPRSSRVSSGQRSLADTLVLLGYAVTLEYCLHDGLLYADILAQNDGEVFLVEFDVSFPLVRLLTAHLLASHDIMATLLSFFPMTRVPPILSPVTLQAVSLLMELRLCVIAYYSLAAGG